MLSVSAIYHARKRSDAARRVLNRVDHSMILVAIAGSYTGIVGLTLEGRAHLAVGQGVVAGPGRCGDPPAVAARALSPDGRAVYVAVGWVALLEIDALQRALTTIELVLLLVGGILYSLGAIVYALHRPNPWPATFGYHAHRLMGEDAWNPPLEI